MAKKHKWLSKLLVFIVIVLICLITLKSNTDLKNYVYKKVFQNNIGLSKINEVYKKYFGSSLPLIDNTNVETVSSQTIEYTNKEEYKDGVKLTVSDGYLVPAMESGLIIFAGEKEDYGNTVVIQRPDDIEVWYCNLNSVGVTLYDYVKKGSTIGDCNDYIYIIYYKDGEVLDYQNYI